ncbi:MAG: type IV secretion system DNA-binding domain-containing protein [Chloroflexi bacterium]|nr:type IV secretion system DNA-binding domain-containing protein [Chloroflexota bacterium]
MFDVTRDIFYAEMATAVYEHLQEFLLTKEKNHCQRVEYLPLEVMQMTCEKLLEASHLRSQGIEAYVLAERAKNTYEIESGALIEKRNREQFGVLVAFIPQGLRLPAEDSYDIQTFKTYDLTGVLRAHVQSLLQDLPFEGQAIVQAVLRQPAVRRLPIDQHLKYLLALKGDAVGWEEAGAYLFHLNLIPDLKLTELGHETRIDRNARCVAALSNPDQSILQAVESLVTDYALDPEKNRLRDNLVVYLHERNVADTSEWVSQILLDESLRARLTFDKWEFRTLTAPGEVKVHLVPLEDPDTGGLAQGLKKEGTNLVATTDAKSPLHLKWETYPKKPDNLGHYLVMVVRDTEDSDSGEELIRKTVKAGRGTLKLSLKDIELDEGETCSAKILIHAKDKTGVILSSDESEPFWIEGGLRIETVTKKVNRIRNRAEAFFEAALKYRKIASVDSEGWEEAQQRMYRIKLESREIYRIAVNPTLYEIELKNISDPLCLGIWQADRRNRNTLELDDLQSVPVSFSDVKSFDEFAQARRTLFEAFQEKDPTGVVETFDLREFKPEIIEYVSRYLAVLDEIKYRLETAKSDGQVNNVLDAAHHLNRIDTIHVRVGASDDEGDLVILAPTHPIKLLWVLQYQQLLFSWSAKLEGVTEQQAIQMVNRDSVDRITSLNIPSALAFGPSRIYINSDNIDLYWGIFPKGDTSDVRKVVSLTLRLLGHKGGGGEITSVTPADLANKIWRYLKHHTYVSTLRLNVINPGDGLLVLNAIREIQKSEEFDALNYDVAFYGDLRYEIMASTFDELMEEVTLTEGSQSEVDEALLKPNRNPLFPKLTFSKQRVRENEWKTVNFREAHITVLIDRFSTKVLTRPANSGVGSFCLHNLLAEYRADFDLRGESATWSRKVVPSQNTEIEPEDYCAELLYRISDGVARLGACFNDWGNSLDKVPAIQIELSDTDKHIINQIHERSDWVFTIDRNFGIEYFDNPRSAPGVSVRSYLIDYTPEFLDGLGHRLIVSTFWLAEIEELIRDGLRKMGILGTGFQAAQILDVLKSISGRLVLKLINNPNDAREIIGLALTRLLLEEEGTLAGGTLIPIDSHIDLFTGHKRQAQDTTIRLHRTDLMLAQSNGLGKLQLQLIEVKFRSGYGNPAEEMALREAIAVKNANTQDVLEATFAPLQESEVLDREIHNKQLANLLQFYIDRSKRHGLLIAESDSAIALQECVRDIERGEFQLEFDKTGYIYNLRGSSKLPDQFQGNKIVVVGSDRIKQLLEISEASDEFSVRVTPAEFEPHPSPRLHTTTVQPVPSDTQIKAQNQTNIEENADISTDAEILDVVQSITSNLDSSQPERVRLGIDYDTDHVVFWDPFTLTPKKLANQHVLIVGKSGAGKTQTASAFIWELSRLGIPAIIFDFQGEYMSDNLVNRAGSTFLECTQAQVLDAADGIEVNPLEVPIDPHSGKKQNYMKVVYQVAASLAKIFGLGDIQHAILRDSIGQAFIQNGFAIGNKDSWENPAPTLSQVWAILQHKESTEGGNVRNLNRRVQPLFETGVFLDASNGEEFESILKHTTIIRLSNLATTELMVAVSRFVLQKLYSYMLAQGPSNHLRIFAVIDEAHKLSYEETLTELIREARKYGVGILLASQSVKDFDRVIFDIVGTKIALQLEGDDAKVMSDNLGLVSKPDRDICRELILSQPPHRALIRSNHFEPYIQADITPFFKTE